MSDEAAKTGRENVGREWLIPYGLLYTGQNLAWSGPVQVLIALQVLAFRPEDKETSFALLMTIGGACQVIGSLLGGILSDRTRSRWGKRLPWILIGNAVAAACLVIQAFAPSYALLFATWSIFQIFLAIAGSSTLSLPPDAVPRRQFGLVSGVQGATYTLGVVGGTLIAALAGVEFGYLISAGIVVVFVAIFAASGAWKRGLVGTGSTTDMLLAEGEESLAKGYSDFIWVFIARFAINLGNYVALFYLLYFLRDRIRLADPETGVLILTGVYALFVIISTIIGGMWSDRVGRRKPFYLAAGVGIALACVLMAIAITFPAAIAGAIMLGLVWGLFTAVDQALVNSVLPVPGKRARDVGVMTVAIAAANIASPLFAAFSLGHLGGYPGLYLASGALVLVGSLAILPVRSVR
ncbi:MFS transporter [Schaalia hyovaginalis]|uniref:MFS transporter n=1 Tax=Schaalia hyovaginalis TaxID=29316 RepID=UPI002A74C9EC|nr:MFS transporter [Schaalia hyovaginalis]MDY2668511.1 MFS transporter [Schaalia hyovaginalis]